MKFLLLLSLTFAFVACSGSKSASEGDDVGIELADAVEFSEESGDIFAEETPEVAPESMEGLADVPMEEAIAPVEGMEAPMEEPVAAMEPVAEAFDQDEAMAASEPVQVEPMTTTGEVGTHVVKKNETLMMVAFKVYGDYGRWREIANMNQDKLNGSTVVSAGMELKYNVPAEPFVFNPSGNPYLIVRGDTLGKISSKTYGQPVYWKNIWENNKPLIKNPNEIFAGFTIYTPVIEGRDVAFDGM